MIWRVIILLLFWPHVAQAQIISMEGFCKNLPDLPRGQGVEFKPNVDNVVPADLNAIKRPVLEPIIIPIEADIAKKYNVNLFSNNHLEAQSDVASIVINPDGYVTYNGEDITGAAFTACRQERGDDLSSQNNKDEVTSVDVEPKLESEKEDTKDILQAILDDLAASRDVSTQDNVNLDNDKKIVDHE